MKTTRERGVIGARVLRACSVQTIRSAAVVLLCWSCGGSAPEPKSSPSPASGAAPADTPGNPAATKGPSLPTSELADNTGVAFRADFAAPELGQPWNVFGAQSGNRQVKGGPDGLWIKIAQAERSWDAVGARTAKVKVDGDFDLRARFRDFSAKGNGSAKLIVVDAATTKGGAAYVELIQIDGKNLFKFGGDVGGSLENWGFTPTDIDRGDLRLVRQGNTLHAYTRPDERSSWTEFAPAQPAPKTMPRVLKFGVKLSSETNLSAQVRWVDLTMNGQIVRAD
jgi:hypothetical protein